MGVDALSIPGNGASVAPKTTLWLPARILNSVGGSSASDTVVNFGWRPWQLSASTGMAVGVSIAADQLQGFTRYSVEAVWAPAGTAGGNVVLRYASLAVAEGSVYGTLNTEAQVTVAAPTVAQQRTTTVLASGLVVPAAGTYLAVRVERMAADAADTATDATNLFGVYLRFT